MKKNKNKNKKPKIFWTELPALLHTILGKDDNICYQLKQVQSPKCNENWSWIWPFYS